MCPVPNAYEVRDSVLRRLGYASYSDYLRGTRWRLIRAHVLALRRRCILCGKPATDVHHLSYDQETLLGFRTHALAPVCRGCHKGIEFSGGRKNSLKHANIKLLKRARVSFHGKDWYRKYRTISRLRRIM